MISGQRRWQIEAAQMAPVDQKPLNENARGIDFERAIIWIMTGAMRHFTNVDGYKGIKAAPEWKFVASTPPGVHHPKGAYFTPLPPSTPALAARLGIPREKIQHVFKFEDAGDLVPINGARGKFILRSKADYSVSKPRQLFRGPAEEEE